MKETRCTFTKEYEKGRAISAREWYMKGIEEGRKEAKQADRARVFEAVAMAFYAKCPPDFYSVGTVSELIIKARDEFAKKGEE